MIELGATFLNWQPTLWDNALYRSLLAVVGAEVLLSAVQVSWLLVTTYRVRITQAHLQRCRQALGDLSQILAAGDEEQALWIARAQRYSKIVRRRYLQEQIARPSLRIFPRKRLAQLYDRLDLRKQDLKMMRSSRWSKRLIGLRNLSQVATIQEKEAILRLRGDRYPIRLVVAQTIGQIGTTAEVIAVLSDLGLSRRIMEQPILSILRGVSAPVFSSLVDRWHTLQSPWLRRVILLAAGSREPCAAYRLLAAAAYDQDIDVRTAACLAAAELGVPEADRHIVKLLDDRQWQVRAQAAKALGKLGGPEAAAGLAASMCDASFWVRQNAAQALSALGHVGRRMLEDIAADSVDRFAADAALQQLQLQEFSSLRQRAAA